jgi:cation:H+ antiporter
VLLTSIGLVAGIGLLVLGGTLLVRGASEVAAGLGVSPLIVGLTIVGFGTSSPELVVNIFGSLRGVTEIAFGNVVGSNISNIGLVLGVAAVVMPITLQSQLIRREVPLLILVTTILTVMALDGMLQGQAAVISRSEGIVLMLLFCVFFYVNTMDMIEVKTSDPINAEVADNPFLEHIEVSKLRWVFVLAGFVLLFAGGELTIRNGISLATGLGVSATVIGLFVVALGTSMPELVTSIIAAMRKEPDLVLGNVVGSNIFNSLIVLPTSAVITDVAVPEGGVIDLLVSWGLVVLLIPFFLFGEARLSRATGVFLLVLYVTYVIARLGMDVT